MRIEMDDNTRKLIDQAIAGLCAIGFLVFVYHVIKLISEVGLKTP